MYYCKVQGEDNLSASHNYFIIVYLFNAFYNDIYINKITKILRAL